MSFFKLFSGPSPEKLEQNGDALFESRLSGKAKLEYERALQKLKKRSDLDLNLHQQLEAKIVQAREALAGEHRQNAADLIDAGCLDDAQDLLALAMELSADEQFRQELEKQLQQVEVQLKQEKDERLHDFLYGLDDDEETSLDTSDNEYFLALCSTLPDDVKDAYLAYGEAFKSGYLALNRGDFQAAAISLSHAMEENSHPESYVPLELATAYLNLGRQTEAQELLEGFLGYHPQVLPAYQLLCEIYWDQKDFDLADTLLSSVPAEFADSISFLILKGETLYQAGDFEVTRDYYRHFLDNNGWNDRVAQELGKTYEALAEKTDALGIYKEIIDRCKSCHSCNTRIDPEIKHKYAELCFGEGLQGTDILELYLSLVREIPENAPHYYDRISRIYSSLGNSSEAERFREFSDRAMPE